MALFNINLKMIAWFISIMLIMKATNAQEQYALAAEDRCFNAASVTTGYEFSPPFDGEIIGIKLQHKSGLVTCYVGAYPNTADWAYWGCGSIDARIDIQMIKNDEMTYYPTATTEGIYDVQSTSNCVCSVIKYFINGYDGYNSEFIELRDSANPKQVSTSDTFSLQYGEGCCGETSHDNAGTSCADVYFIYNNIYTNDPSSDPTLKPTIGPTAKPSTDPTVAPSANPSTEPTSSPTKKATDNPAAALVVPQSAEITSTQPLNEAEILEAATTEEDDENEPQHVPKEGTSGFLFGMNQYQVVIIVIILSVLMCCFIALLCYCVLKQVRAINKQVHEENMANAMQSSSVCNEDTLPQMNVVPPKAVGQVVFVEQALSSQPRVQQAHAFQKTHGAIGEHGICGDCGMRKKGKIYDGNRTFYCSDCWDCYDEDDGTDDIGENGVKEDSKDSDMYIIYGGGDNDHTTGGTGTTGTSATGF